MSSQTIIALLVPVCLALCGYLGYRYVRRRVGQLSEALFGTKSLVDGINRQKDLVSEMPRSVSGMTRVFAPQIQRDFPDFQPEQFRDKAENLLMSVLQAVDQESTAALPADVSQEIVCQVENQIAGNRAAGVRERCRSIRIHRTEIANYRKQQGTCVITFQSAVEFYHYKEKNGVVVEGEKERKKQTKYNMELMYIQDESLASIDGAVGMTCPSCGAPITNLGNLRCEYCGQAVQPVNLKVWTLHQYYEVDYHHV